MQALSSTSMTNEQLGSSRAYGELKDRIIRGDLTGGTLLSEARIGEELGLSRTPVHNAFLQLESEGLVTLASRRGAVVSQMSPRESRDVLEMRKAIEGAAAAAVVERPNARELAEPALAEVVATQHRLLEADDVDGFVESDEAFHATVVEASGNQIARHFWTLLRDRQQRLRYQVLTLRRANLTQALEDHDALRAALQDRDAEAYRVRLAAHVAMHEGAL